MYNHLTGSAYAETYFELAAEKGMYVDMETGKLYKEQPEKIETIRLSKEMDRFTVPGKNDHTAQAETWVVGLRTELLSILWAVA